MANLWGWSEEESLYIAYVYMVICLDSAGVAFIKFGLTSSPDSRLTQLRVGCPLPVKMFCLAETDCRFKAKKAERAFHRAFEKRHVTGEWFKFDIESAEDKREFNEASRKIFARFMPPSTTWAKINMVEFDKLQTQRRNFALICARKRRRMEFTSSLLRKRPPKIVRFDDSGVLPTLHAGDKVAA